MKLGSFRFNVLIRCSHIVLRSQISFLRLIATMYNVYSTNVVLNIIGFDLSFFQNYIIVILVFKVLINIISNLLSIPKRFISYFVLAADYYVSWPMATSLFIVTSYNHIAASGHSNVKPMATFCRVRVAGQSIILSTCEF